MSNVTGRETGSSIVRDIPGRVLNILWEMVDDVGRRGIKLLPSLRATW